MLSGDLNIKCQNCNENSKLEEWNEESKKMCTSREMRRQYTDLKNERVFTGKKEAYYICPKCKKWSKGIELIVFSESGEKINGLGGKPNFGREYTLTTKGVSSASYNKQRRG